MNRLLFICALFLSEVTAFQSTKPPLVSSHQPTLLYSKKSDGGGEAPVQQQAFAVGTFVEFEEKKRVHIGTIEDKEHKANGGARYKVVDRDGKRVSHRGSHAPMETI